MKGERLLTNLIEIKSLSGREEELRMFLENWFAEKGVESFRQDDNLIVHLAGSDRSRAFIFNSHMDTVGSGEEDWQYGPWTPTRESKKLVGLGASDMKAGLAATMLLAERYSDGRKLPVDVWFTYVVKEEVDGSGTESLANWFQKEGFVEEYQQVAGIFTEPTYLREIEHGHRGNLFFQVEASGDTGHSSRPGRVEELAVKKIVTFGKRLKEKIIDWREEFPDTFFNPSITVGEFTSIQAGLKIEDEEAVPESPNKFPSRCKATFDLRTTPDFHPSAFDKLVELGGEEDVSVSMLYPAAPPGFTDPDSEIVEVVKALVEETKLTVSQGSADLGFLTELGVEAVIFGPGEKDQAHQLNEYCYPKQVSQAVELYDQIVFKWS